MDKNGEKGVEREVGTVVQPAIQFPALSFSQGLVGVITSLETQCTKLGFKRGYYKNLTLVDSAGNQFHVVGARKIRRLPFRFRFGDFLEFLGGNPRWEVELIFEPTSSRITADEVKNLLFRSFRKDRYFWSEMCDFEEFRDRIKSASSIEQIFGAFKEFNQF